MSGSMRIFSSKMCIRDRYKTADREAFEGQKGAGHLEEKPGGRRISDSVLPVQIHEKGEEENGYEKQDDQENHLKAEKGKNILFPYPDI